MSVYLCCAFFSRTHVKVQWLSHLSLWQRLALAGSGPGTANMKHLLFFQLKSSDCWTAASITGPVFLGLTPLFRFSLSVPSHLAFSPLISDLFFVSLFDGWIHYNFFLQPTACVSVYGGMFSRSCLQLFQISLRHTRCICAFCTFVWRHVHRDCGSALPWVQ